MSFVYVTEFVPLIEGGINSLSLSNVLEMEKYTVSQTVLLYYRDMFKF